MSCHKYILNLSLEKNLENLTFHQHYKIMYAWQSKLNTKSISEFSPNIQILLLKKYCVLKFFSKINSHLKNSHITVLKKNKYQIPMEQ